MLLYYKSLGDKEVPFIVSHIGFWEKAWQVDGLVEFIRLFIFSGGQEMVFDCQLVEAIINIGAQRGGSF